MPATICCWLRLTCNICKYYIDSSSCLVDIDGDISHCRSLPYIPRFISNGWAWSTGTPLSRSLYTRAHCFIGSGERGVERSLELWCRTILRSNYSSRSLNDYCCMSQKMAALIYRRSLRFDAASWVDLLLVRYFGSIWHEEYSGKKSGGDVQSKPSQL
ncbi:hypothetical protein Patl1_26229 [Pistacia atlantica]|uniref:Uncharacterized protein n=1 Tax=Pistacia atlantica TaxID=434234 RepID=A0ACC1AZP9_9ROSI|nr:hypothetical protein Patl1_26229 [Pistacia atlantica]